ncbi:short chain dehydrogenase [Pseudoalteromonas phenolica]|uniref:Short chain dehydrogenase n=1 Tax=Pseudoalteromonas phenolica TaxID=161398 RepID=A0A0S2K2V8_9GAMM|nr:short chain dehydrogenase [Pseudoalteromonas phenolica]ALO42736.1 Short chain dehydrogenase [Pseudoalteromonas phenolica]MBE0356155.1 hypothetical protein [Pseudoalteromonas phenolica O-BC30]RXF05695.1 short chain dehydrogenase [Pseudoalteromonas phenolica O-BC30]
MKKVLVLGSTGLLGSKVISKLEGKAQIIGASLNDAQYLVDLSKPESLKALFKKVGKVDAIVCTAGMVNFIPWSKASDSDWQFGIENKMMGQINTLRFGTEYVNDGGAIILTTGVLAQHPFPSSSIVSAVNAAVESALKAASLEVENVRFNAVSPGWVKETMDSMGMDSEQGTPAAEIAQIYIDLIETSVTGDIHVAAK